MSGPTDAGGVGPQQGALVARLAGAAADLAEVGAEYSRCLGCQCYRRPVEEALSLLDEVSSEEPIAAYLVKLLASPVEEHG
jgi:hypothetical protein